MYSRQRPLIRALHQEHVSRFVAWPWLMPKSRLFRSCFHSHVTTVNRGTRTEYRFTLYAAFHADRSLLTRIVFDAENFCEIITARNPRIPYSRRFPDITVRTRAAGTRTIILSNNRNSRGRHEWPPAHRLLYLAKTDSDTEFEKIVVEFTTTKYGKDLHQFCSDMECESRKGFLMADSASQWNLRVFRQLPASSITPLWAI